MNINTSGIIIIIINPLAIYPKNIKNNVNSITAINPLLKRKKQINESIACGTKYNTETCFRKYNKCSFRYSVQQNMRTHINILITVMLVRQVEKD